MSPDEGPMFVNVLAVDDAGNAQKRRTTYSLNVGDGRAPQLAETGRQGWLHRWADSSSTLSAGRLGTNLRCGRRLCGTDTAVRLDVSRASNPATAKQFRLDQSVGDGSMDMEGASDWTMISPQSPRIL